MPSLQTIALFMGTALVLNLTSGPAILFILSRCLGEGPRCGYRIRLWAGYRVDYSRTRGGVRFISLVVVFATGIQHHKILRLVYLGISGLMKGGIAGAKAGIGKRSRTILNLLAGLSDRSTESETSAVLLLVSTAICRSDTR
jgi:hypothetical protein